MPHNFIQLHAFQTTDPSLARNLALVSFFNKINQSSFTYKRLSLYARILQWLLQLLQLNNAYSNSMIIVLFYLYRSIGSSTAVTSSAGRIQRQSQGSGGESDCPTDISSTSPLTSPSGSASSSSSITSDSVSESLHDITLVLSTLCFVSPEVFTSLRWIKYFHIFRNDSFPTFCE